MPSRAKPKEPEPTGTSVALLRGINVGGNNPVPMRDLAALFTEAGCSSVRTYIQSGNVVFSSPPKAGAGLAALLAKRIQARFGVAVPVVLRTAAELASVVRDNPFLAEGSAPDVLHVVFLADAPTAEAAARLDPARSPPDTFRVVGREIYLRCPDGFGRTKLTNAWFDRALGTTSTVRNWRTVEKLLAMSSGSSGAGGTGE